MITLQWNENALEELHEELAGSDKMTPVFSIHNSDYDWKQMLAIFSPEDDKFYWITGEGCACCDSLFEHIKSFEELASGSASELKGAVRAFHATNPDIMTEADRTRIFSKIKKHSAN